VPRLVAIAGLNQDAVAEAARRYGYERWTTDWHDIVTDERIGLFDNGGPTRSMPSRTIAADEAGKHVLCEKPLGARPTRATRLWRRVAATGVKHLCGFQLPLRPRGATCARTDRRGRTRRAPPLPRPLPAGLGRRSDARHVALRPGPAGSGALGDLGTHVIDLARYLVGEFGSVAGDREDVR